MSERIEFRIGETVIYCMGAVAGNRKAFVRSFGRRKDNGNPYYCITPYYESGQSMKSRCVSARFLRPMDTVPSLETPATNKGEK